ncbi:hypothetical protein [Streptomyces sp. NPDC004533]
MIRAPHTGGPMFHRGTTILDLVAPCGFVLMVAGVVLQILGRHPGRVRV